MVNTDFIRFFFQTSMEACFYFNPNTEFVRYINSPEVEKGFSVCVLKNELYIIGGSISFNKVASSYIPTVNVKKYDHNNDEWCFQADLNIPRLNPGKHVLYKQKNVCTLFGYVY